MRRAAIPLACVALCAGAAAPVQATTPRAVTAAPALSAPPTVVTVPPGLYGPPTIEMPRGRALRLVQLDPLARHDVISRHVRRGRPLFASRRTLGFGEGDLVARVERLGPGIYPFTCSIHPFMAGRLLVKG